MKKFLGTMLLALLLVLPFSVKAEQVLNHSCTQADANGIVNCTITYNITDEAGWDEMTVYLFEYGGATINSITNADSDWQLEGNPSSVVGTPADVTLESTPARTWIVKLSAPSVKGQGNAFNFSYKVSGTEDCKITYGLKDNTPTPIVPDKPSDETPKTGSTLPYLALGAVVVLATGAYIATKNKSKMYKI